jgi:hypothetical protein
MRPEMGRRAASDAGASNAESDKGAPKHMRRFIAKVAPSRNWDVGPGVFWAGWRRSCGDGGKHEGTWFPVAKQRESPHARGSPRGSDAAHQRCRIALQ